MDQVTITVRVGSLAMARWIAQYAWRALHVTPRWLKPALWLWVVAVVWWRWWRWWRDEIDRCQ